MTTQPAAPISKESLLALLFQATTTVQAVPSARIPALHPAFARAEAVRRDLELVRVLSAERRAEYAPRVGATDIGGVMAEMELMDAATE